MPEIHKAKLTWIWSQTVLEAFDASRPSGTLPFIGRLQEYEWVFQHAAEGNAVLELPWLRSPGQLFWQYYLKNHIPTQINGSYGWKYLVPLRLKLPVKLQAPSLPFKVLLEGFYYPHGVGLVMTVFCDGIKDSISELVDRLHKIRYGRFNVEWNNALEGVLTAPSAPSTDRFLNQIQGDLLESLRTAAFGEKARVVHSQREPFSIFTVLEGSVEDISAPVADGGEVHRALQGLADWSKTWGIDQLTPLQKARLDIKGSAASHLLYSMKRGRAIWFPGFFSQTQYEGRTLSCYHRNQAFVSLQIESLVGLIVAVADMLDSRQSVRGPLSDCARNAAHVLGSLWKGDDGTYRSHSAKAHLQESLDKINLVRKFYEKDPLG